MNYRDTTRNFFDFININPEGDSKPILFNDYEQQASLSQTSDAMTTTIVQSGGFHPQDKKLMKSANIILLDKNAKIDERRGANLISTLIHRKVNHYFKNILINSEEVFHQYRGSTIKWGLNKISNYFD